MQVILLEKINHLGDLGDIVKVKDGYARNFLIPTKRAKRATEAAIAEFEARRAELERAQAERIAAAEEMAAKLNGVVVEITSKAGVDGRLFGSVTNADIAEALKAQGFEIKKSQVRTPLGAIKAVGEYTLTIGLLGEIVADITVKVVAEAA
ncbi:MAG: 50S ribosomal protein L9 [Burkholderiaceae bacterium]|nr:50S ribosomal protein L9 [Burkholderiaceae bacterium]